MIAGDKTYAELEAEVARLLEALRTIADDDPGQHDGFTDEWTEAAAYHRVQDIARAAIAKSEDAT